MSRTPKEMSPALLVELSERFKALADKKKSIVLAALRAGEQSVGALVERTGLGQANVSRHLQQLTAAGYVRRRKEGTFAFYALADDDVFRLCDLMCGRLEAEARERRATLRHSRA